jgi:hypothetical protein
MKFEPGLYCGTTKGIYPVNYCDIPDTRIFTAWKFFKALQTLKTGLKVYGEFNLDDQGAWECVQERLKNY